MKRPWSILSTISLSSLTMEHSEYTNGIEHSLCYKIVFNNSKRLVDRGVQMSIHILFADHFDDHFHFVYSNSLCLEIMLIL
ncbi:unnamed protein product [Acanthoscelides obtectus]|uniref:Uncharacterized protein n=1 Tax=Acanthoscelides obtectus TaxID=200917 RepID=A0A9P0PF03_ACAOB|nr:unnamed protein product [Acanthoscelides obtectus]CAH1990592.1 unnamed protein product [Acanthoscelides obtectus]CAK1669274.1 hypothetical protein AOBTE_LOCUS26916 [Acanthoscelides obtectus]CAK1684271.1 hypothetical protein AOBTE_LOCUS34764 [Acanthoscelides obtectus]